MSKTSLVYKARSRMDKATEKPCLKQTKVWGWASKDAGMSDAKIEFLSKTHGVQGSAGAGGLRRATELQTNC